ncbi:MAG: hypothetical protein ACEQSL_10470, partial [Sediminibacterium sp.]
VAALLSTEVTSTKVMAFFLAIMVKTIGLVVPCSGHCECMYTLGHEEIYSFPFFFNIGFQTVI